MLHERGMELSQSKGGSGVLRCAVQCAGVDGEHKRRASFEVAGPRSSAGILTVVVGPNQLRMDREVQLNSTPARGGVYWCEGLGRTSSEATILARPTWMTCCTRIEVP